MMRSRSRSRFWKSGSNSASGACTAPVEKVTSGWIPGEIIEDHYEVLMGRDVPAWKYDIFVGMYDPVTGERLPVSSAKAPISENRIWLTRLPAVDD